MAYYVKYTDKNKTPVEIDEQDIDNTKDITLFGRRRLEYGEDMNTSIILNESAVKELEIPDPIGKVVIGKTIIGVVKDFNLHSLHTKIPPLCISLSDEFICD